MKIKFLTIFILLAQFCFGQTNNTQKPLTEQIDSLSFLIVEIDLWSERFHRKEINVIYYQGNEIKIHSILKSNYHKEEDIDTTFILSATQLMHINKFADDFNRNNIHSDEIAGAGSRTFYYITLDGVTRSLDSKNGYIYSLIMSLLRA